MPKKLGHATVYWLIAHGVVHALGILLTLLLVAMLRLPAPRAANYYLRVTSGSKPQSAGTPTRPATH